MPHPAPGGGPPLVYRLLLRLAGYLCPAAARAAWRRQWESGLHDWWILAERGELTNKAAAVATRYCRGACADALERRCSRAQLLHTVRGPAFPLLCTAVVIALTGLLSHGFQVFRHIVNLALTYRPITHRVHYDPRGDAIVAYLAPVTLSLLVATMLLVIGRLPVLRSGWRYWGHLLLKTLALQLALILLWFEGGAALRAVIPSEPLRLLGGGLFLALVFMAAFGYATVWSIADQRRRCPVCLRRLDMPVSVGSWGSVFEPATTELLCAGGHGALSFAELDNTAPDRWTALDASWRELFDSAAPPKTR